MWLLRKLGKSDKVFHIISAKGIYSVGRKNKDITLEDDSISRSHCTIKIAQKSDCPFIVDTATGVWIIDEGSKYGTFIQVKDKEKDFVELEKKAVKKLEHNSVIRFGLLENIFKVEYKPIIICTSMVTKEQTDECKKILSEIDGVLKSNWDRQCSLVIVNNITLSKKVVLALITGVPVVLPGYLRELANSIKNGTPAPDYKEFKPPIGEKALKGNLVSLDVKDNRKELFKGKIFMVPTKSQYDNLKDIILAASGEIKILEKNCNWHKFGGENIIIVKYPLDARPDIVNDYKKNMQMLKDKYSKRIVPENEIPQAIAYSSIEKFCNPKFMFEVRKSMEENSKGEVIEEETPTVSEEMLAAGSMNLVPGSATQIEAESNSMSVLDMRPGILNNRKRGLSPEVPTPSKKRTIERNVSITPSPLESQSLMTNVQTQEIEKANEANKKNLEKRPSINRSNIQIDDPNQDEFWTTPNTSQPNPHKRKQSDDKSPPPVAPLRKKTKIAVNNNDEPSTSSKNNDKTKNARKSHPRIEPAVKKARTASDALEPPTSFTSLNGRKSPSPKPGPSSYSKSTISDNRYQDEDGDEEWISCGNFSEGFKAESSEELNSTVVMLNLVSISYTTGKGDIKEPAGELRNVKRFRKQTIKSTREYVPVQQIDSEDDDDDWTSVKAFRQEMI